MRRLILLFAVIVTGCSSLGVVDAPSVNHNSRIQYLVLHFTSEEFAESLRLLTQETDNSVSAHYLIPEPGDATYDRHSVRIHRLVPEQRRAWHAGASYWAGADALNDTSIGIEMVNRSACLDDVFEPEAPTPEDHICKFFAFPEEQIDLVIRLARDILDRHPDIDPVDVVGHGDIAPARRVDPGPKFPWKRLYEHGIGAWYDDATVAKYSQQFRNGPPALNVIQRLLLAYGYDVEETGGNDVQMRYAVRAFQMHFRPANTSGQADAETAAILFALVEKYRPEARDMKPAYHEDT